MTLCLATGIGRGGRAAVAAAIGVGAGCIVHALAAALGLAALARTLPGALTAVQWTGAAYLLWLGLENFRRPAVLSRPEATDKGTVSPMFWRGFVTNVLNPKVAIFFLAFLPQFVTPGGWPIWQQVALFAAVIIVQGTVINAAVGLAAGRAATSFAARPWAGRMISYVSGSLMLGLAARLAWSELPAR